MEDSDSLVFGEGAITCLDTEVAFDNISQQWKSPKGDLVQPHPNAWSGIKAWNPNSPAAQLYSQNSMSRTPTKEEMARAGMMQGYQQGSPRSQWSGNQSPTNMFAPSSLFEASYQNPAVSAPISQEIPLDSLKPIRTQPSNAGMMQMPGSPAGLMAPPVSPVTAMAAQMQNLARQLSPGAMNMLAQQLNTQYEMSNASYGRAPSPYNQPVAKSPMSGYNSPRNYNYNSPRHQFQPDGHMTGSPLIGSPSAMALLDQGVPGSGDISAMISALQQINQAPLPPREAPKPSVSDLPTMMQLMHVKQLVDGGNNTPTAGGERLDMMALLAATGNKNAAEWAQTQGSMLSTIPNVHQLLNSQMLQEFASSRTTLIQLLVSAHTFLTSDHVRMFCDRMMPISHLYDEMHDLPVVQKRRRCQEMSFIRNQLVKDPWFTGILQAICALRSHIYSFSRKVLLMNNGPDATPLDVLLGSMSNDLHHIVKGSLTQEICEFFTNSMPHPCLALLVFSEFTTVDPGPATVVNPLASIEAVGQ